MHYLSTRGADRPLPFADTLMAGLARDGGLYLPEAIPDARPLLSAWRALPYPTLAFEIIRRFAPDLPADDLRALIARGCAAFRHPDITPVLDRGGLHLLELFHGPTLAFKDVALQLLGPLFEYTLERRDAEMNILAATSGDTGSAAIHGVKGRRRLRLFVLYPHGRVSPMQELQMTTVPDANVFCLAVRGSFDDCQQIVKTLFGDLAFRDRHRLGAVNSINWARIVAQIVYYFYAAFRVLERTGCARVRFAVPTGNFGDIFAGYIAWRMGLPIARLLLATNENDILARFFQTGVYRRGAVRATLSPSMDIQIASNFERYLYYRLGEDPRAVGRAMRQFAETGELSVACPAGAPVDPLFAAGVTDTAATLATIRRWHETHAYLLDPHTACGVHVAETQPDPAAPTICLATAHPAKFADAIRQATGRDLARHELLDALAPLPTRRTVLPADPAAVRAFVEQTLAGRST